MDDLPPERIRGRNLSEGAYQAVSRMILERRLRGGDAIVEQRLAEQLGISRTPLRESLQRLEGEGLVIKSANRPFVVRQVELKEYLHSLKVREILEAEAAAAAAGRIPREAIEAVRADVRALEGLAPYDKIAHWECDRRVHALFIDACGNDVMAGIIKALRVTTHLFEIAQLADRLEPDAREHLAILEALDAGDAKGARRTVTAHCRSLFRFAIDRIR